MEAEKTESTQSARSAPSSIHCGTSKNLKSERKEPRSSRSTVFSISEYLTFGIICFAPTILGLIALGFAHYSLCLMFYDFPRIHGFLQLCLGYFAWEWLDLYGSRRTRKENFSFDEKNIRETSKPVLDDKTPDGIAKELCCGKYPTVDLIKSLIADPKQAKMLEFYKHNYGDMYQIALRESQEAKGKTTSPKTDSLKTIRSASKAESQISISPLPAKSDERQKSQKQD